MNSSKKLSLKQWLNNATQILTDHGISSARSDCLLMLSHTIEQGKSYILAHPDVILTTEQKQRCNLLLSRRLRDEPVAYIVEEKEFYGRMFRVDSRGLIPRWETELLIETSLTWLKQQSAAQIVADIGTGSGTIILTLAAECPDHHFLATDISEDALDLARENAERFGLTAVHFHRGDLAQPLMGSYAGKINLLTANLPYIPDALLLQLDPTVRYYEPEIALAGGDDGLDLYRAFMPQAKQLLAPDGLMLLEHDDDQGDGIGRIARASFPGQSVVSLRDGLGHDRVLKLVNMTGAQA